MREWPGLWGFVYEAENRARRDEMESLRRQAERVKKLNLEWCRDYDANLPWEETNRVSELRNAVTSQSVPA